MTPPRAGDKSIRKRSEEEADTGTKEALTWARERLHEGPGVTGHEGPYSHTESDNRTPTHHY